MFFKLAAIQFAAPRLKEGKLSGVVRQGPTLTVGLIGAQWRVFVRWKEVVRLKLRVGEAERKWKVPTPVRILRR